MTADTAGNDSSTAQEEHRKAGEMTFWEHLAELRTRIIRSLIAIVAGTIVVAILRDRVFDFFLDPYCQVLEDIDSDEPCSLYIRDPIESFRVVIKVSFFGGLAIAMPVILWQLWRFITPALKANERRWAVPFVTAGLILFSSGVALGYWVFPRALQFFIEVGGDNINQLYGPSEYFSLIIFLMLSFGLGFEFPILLIFLQLAGIIDYRSLAKYRRHAIVGIVVLAAVITPTGDPVTLGALSIPLYLFYEASIVIGWFLTRHRRDQPNRSLRDRLPSWLGGNR
ncbi:MAG: twin-arginine translocase subunit TatC [Actinomycetia bacterium]|nr:twin-arginine translocase subunit TatC [Actinomycetes bacterium]MCP4959315.1 twin-arginine translocase subunit TatC [Actinomycetes bacterium]